MTYISKRLVACLLIASSCSASKHVPLQATWYFVDTKDTNGNAVTKMYVAVLNRSLEPVRVKKILLNSQDLKKNAAWQLTDLDISLGPGEMLFRSVESFSRTQDTQSVNWLRQDCRVPIAVTIKDGVNSFSAEMIGVMPTSAPEGWLENKCPHQ